MASVRSLRQTNVRILVGGRKFTRVHELDLPLTSLLEGMVILKKNPEYVPVEDATAKRTYHRASEVLSDL